MAPSAPRHAGDLGAAASGWPAGTTKAAAAEAAGSTRSTDAACPAGTTVAGNHPSVSAGAGRAVSALAAVTAVTADGAVCYLVFAIKQPDGAVSLGRLAASLRDRRIPLQLCPGSNVQTGAVAVHFHCGQ